MSEVVLGQCPVCRLLLERIEGRPNGVAHHHCAVPEEAGVMTLVSTTAGKSELSMEEAAQAGVRVMLAQAMEGKPFDAHAYGNLLVGLAKLKTAGGDGEDEALARFFAAEEDLT